MACLEARGFPVRGMRLGASARSAGRVMALRGEDFVPMVLPHSYAFNLFSHDADVDDRAGNNFPMPSEASGQDDVPVGRVRTDLGDPGGCTLAMFVVGDQLLKGAALNAVQIADALMAGRCG